jgi:hypothetical protein
VRQRQLYGFFGAGADLTPEFYFLNYYNDLSLSFAKDASAEIVASVSTDFSPHLMSRQIEADSAKALIFQWHANCHDSNLATLPDSSAAQ